MLKMKLSDMCPNLFSVPTTKNKVIGIEYGYNDKLYRIKFENGYEQVTANPDERILKNIKMDDLEVKNSIYINS